MGLAIGGAVPATGSGAWSLVSRALFSLLGASLLFWGGPPGSRAASLPVSIQRLPLTDQQDLRFVRLSVGGQPFQKRVLAITQDNYGFLWLGTDDGLYRYDGYTLRPYRHDPNNPRSLSDNTVFVIYKDRAGILWIGTGYGGLDRLDPAQDGFTQYRHDPNDNRSLRDGQVFSLYQDRAGALWIGTSHGLDCLDVASGRFFHYPHPSDNPGAYAIWGLYEDGPGHLLVGCAQGLYKLERESGHFSLVSNSPLVSSGREEPDLQWFGQDRSGVVWFTTPYGHIVGALNAKTGELRRYALNGEGSPKELVVSKVHEDRHGVLWIGTVGDGLLKVDRERRKVSRYATTGPDGRVFGQIWALLEDAEGNLWVGSESGVSRFQTAPLPFVNYQHEPHNPHSLRNNKVLSVHAEARGFLWIGTVEGLQRLDRRTGQMVLYQHDPKNPNSLSSNAVSAIAEDGSGGLWIGTHGGGLNRFDRASGRFFAYRHNPKDPHSLSSDVVLSLWVEPGGGLWVGTDGGGLNRFDPATGHFKTDRYDPRLPQSLSHDIVRALFRDRAGTLWVGTNRGLNRLDPEAERFTVYLHHERDAASLSHDGISSIYEDHLGTLWIGTHRGLNRLDRTRGSFVSFTTQDGLSDDFIEAIQEDSRGNLWLATHEGLSAFCPTTKTVRNYSESDGLPGAYQDPTGSGDRSGVTPDGELVFGSDDGVTVFDPHRVSAHPFRPPVVLTDFLLFNQPVLPSRDAPLQQPIWATRSLTLHHQQSIFTLQFAALSYVAPERNRYRYRLEGLESEWNEVDSTRRSATYTNLAAGHYTFRVQGSNNDLVWNDAGLRLALTVLPPWWGTWWFRCALAFCLAGLLWTAHQLRLRGLLVTAARLECQVAERTRELQEAKESAEMAKDAAESANRAKSTFLSQMNHELRTPLNAILGFAHLLRQDGASERQRVYLDTIHRSGEHLLGLIDDVLDVAKIEAGRATVELAPCDLGRLVGDVADMMRVRASEKNLELRLVQAPGFPPSVETDAPKLRQMLINLLANAVKYTERGSVTLRVDSHSTAEPGQVLLRFEVEDSGPGIAPEDQVRIFEPFVQVGKTRQKGTGLGLTITRQYAVLLGGTIQVTSAPGKGSLFRLEVPAQCVEKIVTKVVAERDYVLEAGQPEYRILVVDDEPENRDLLQRLLEKAGFLVRTAHNGAEAVELFQSWRPHFIWMDLRMPEVDGAEAARRIRALEGGGEVRIVAVTAFENQQIVAETMDDYVLKPYRAHEIFDCLARHLGARFRSDSGVPPPSAEPPLTLRPEALAALPDDLRTELTAAVLALDRNHIAAVIQRVSEMDGTVGSVLAFHADRLAYSQIWRLLTELDFIHLKQKWPCER